MAKKIYNSCIILFLIVLFIVPSRFLSRLSDELVEMAELSVDAVHSEDWETGLENLERMNALFRLNKSKMHMFLHHAIIEEIDAALRSCMNLMHIQDQPQSLQELQTIITHARYLKSIESCDWFTVL